ncbi:MAG: DUF1501 domain-containing protein [Verrucomicrobiota bacterium]
MNEEAFYENNSLFTRRDYLGMTKGACAGVGLTAMSNTLLHQKLLAAVSSTSDPSDYKALVCVFLYGGNDGWNTFLPAPSGAPVDDFFSNYTRDRGAVAIAGEDILPVRTPIPGVTEQFGFHPELSFFRDQFEAGDMAVVSNVGTLIEPVTAAQYLDRRNNPIPLPPQLFSHSDQQMQWQTSLPGQNSTSGWGGRLGDAAREFNAGASVSISVSVGRSNIFAVGNQISRLDLSGGVASLTSSGPGGMLQAAEDIRNLSKPHLFEKEFAKLVNNAVGAEAILDSVIVSPAPTGTPGALFQARPGDTLFQQLRSVTQMLAARDELNLKRQIFFVSYPGFDSHGTQLTSQANRLEAVNAALSTFWAELTALGLTDQVTTFTVTDFGRSFAANQNGTDHAWGNNSFVMGGDVNGGRVFGEIPDFELGGQFDVGRGRFVPSVSSDQYAATLAKWFGVAESDLSTVVPNIGSFDSSDLGFMETV